VICVRHAAASLLFGLGMLGAIPSLADATPALPGGATSLREVHGDWVVQCDVAAANAPTPGIVCSVNQNQQDPKSQQLVLGVAVAPSATGVGGTMVLPFGLSLAEGVSLQVDEATDQSKLAFRTCLPQGCLVTLSWASDAIAGLRTAKVLNINAVADGGQKLAFKVSMNGFASAMDRVTALMAPTP
jgi:invasion protein IalB